MFGLKVHLVTKRCSSRGYYFMRFDLVTVDVSSIEISSDVLLALGAVRPEHSRRSFLVGGEAARVRGLEAASPRHGVGHVLSRRSTAGLSAPALGVLARKPVRYSLLWQRKQV